MKRYLFVFCIYFLITGNNVYATVVQIPQTGQTTSYASGDDGALQRGAAWSDVTRFTDNGNGTVIDNLSGLIWLKKTDCFGTKIWNDALTAANNLAAGTCGLNDGSIAGQWRLPNIVELESLIDAEHRDPALPTGHPFSGIQSNAGMWTSSTFAGGTDSAWYVNMSYGRVGSNYKRYDYYVWPVRSRR